MRDFVFGDHFAIYPNAFAKSDEVRGSEKTGAISSGAADRIDHRANRAFAVCAGDMDDTGLAKIDIQFAEQALNVFEPELDPEALRAVKPGQRFPVIHGADEK